MHHKGFVRSIGRWTMTALVINAIIGGSIFGLPGELTRLLGRASPFAMIFSALVMGIVVACFAEVSSQFSEPGGAYLYVRAAFGRFAGIQVGWFELLNITATVGALANLFADYLVILAPGLLNSKARILLFGVLIIIPAAANYRGVRKGTGLSRFLTVAKLAPLILLIVLGVAHFARQPEVISASEVLSPGISNWLRSMVLLLAAFAGWEDTLVPSGEVCEPKRTLPFALAAGLLGCAVVFTLLQFIVVATPGVAGTDARLADTASLLLGRGGASFVAISALISTAGWISGAILYAPRLAYSLAAQGDFPSLFARLHPQFRTPAIAILFFAAIAWTLASTGTFLWLFAVSAGGTVFLYVAVCASLVRLRKQQPTTDALRVPGGAVLSVAGICVTLTLLTGLALREISLVGVTAALATINWWWVSRRRTEPTFRSGSKPATQSPLAKEIDD